MDFLLKQLPPKDNPHGWDGFGQHDPEYVIIPNIEIPKGRGDFFEVDTLLIAPHAIYVIEVKDWGPRIEGNDNQWYLNGRRERPNPNKTTKFKARCVNGFLTQKAPDLRRAWCQHVVVIARPDATLDLVGECVWTSYRLDKSLTDYLQAPGQLSSHWHISENQIARLQREIIEHLIGEGRNRQPKTRIKHYHIVEKWHEDEQRAEYLVRSTLGHVQGGLKRLKIFTLPLYEVDAEKRKAIEQKLYRSFDAMQLIGNHPNIASMQIDEDYKADKVIEITDWSEQGTLRSVIGKGTLTLDQKIQIVKSIAEGLQAAQAKEIYHRDLCPENILMTTDVVPQLMNFDLAYIEDPELVTVWKTVDETKDQRYLPLELTLSRGEYDVYPSSDLYSLGVIFYELLCGNVPYENPRQFEAAGGVLPDDKLPSKFVPGLPIWIDEVIKKLYIADVRDRYADVDEFLKDLQDRMLPTSEQEEISPVEKEPEDTSHLPTNRTFRTGERIGDYRIVRYIKSGGFAQVYLAIHLLQEREYALKVNNQSVPLTALIDEFRFLNELNHPNIVKVYWSGQLPDGRYYLAMEFLQGESLALYAWDKKRMPLTEVLQVGKDVLSALRYLHEGDCRKTGVLAGKPVYHRDIKPSNIIEVKDRGYVLIDFNVAKEADKSQTHAGTDPYIAPDLDQGNFINWDDSADTFALGITLYELICKEHPYPDDMPRLHVDPKHPHDTEYGKDLSEKLCEFLLKAVQPQAENRFRSAREMETVLLQVIAGDLYKPPSALEASLPFSLEPEERNRPNYNPFVTRLRRLFSQAQHSNAGTRGLDEIARKTYVQTLLDAKLVPAILNGEFRLVIITGNAGDGKTALIQQLEERAQNLQQLPSKNGSRFEICGIPFQTNYDGSQDEGDKENDQVLEDFLDPFAKLTDFSQATEGRILAINEGRLMEFLGAEERTERFGVLYEALDAYFNERSDAVLPRQMIVVNLNWRSVVAEVNGTPSLLEKQLSVLLRDEFWASCRKCQFMDRCFILHNAETLGDPAAGAEIRDRLAQTFEVVHLRRELHITMRDLRSALSFIICRDHGCEDIPRLLDNVSTDEQRLDYAALAYWNITDESAADIGNEDRLIRLIRQIDVGQVAQPAADRDLHFLPLDPNSFLWMEEQEATDDYTTTMLSEIQQRIQNYVPAEIRETERNIIRRLQRMMIRKFYFEGRDPAVRSRLPYQNFEAFKNVLNNDLEARENALNILVHAVSLGEGCRNQKLAQENICISSSGEKDPRYSSFRLFPKTDFTIVVRDLGGLGEFLEHTPDRFILQNRQHPEVVLEVNLDLFELMNYVERGFSPSLNDLYGHYIELIIFKNTLQNLPYRSVLLTDDHQRFYRVWVTEENKLVMEKV